MSATHLVVASSAFAVQFTVGAESLMSVGASFVTNNTAIRQVAVALPAEAISTSFTSEATIKAVALLNNWLVARSTSGRWILNISQVIIASLTNIDIVLALRC
jgi:hypothetical protein